MKRKINLKIHRLDMYVEKEIDIEYLEEKEGFDDYTFIASDKLYYWDSKKEKVAYKKDKDALFIYIIDKMNRGLYVKTIYLKYNDTLDSCIKNIKNVNTPEQLAKFFDDAFNKELCEEEIKRYQEYQAERIERDNKRRLEILEEQKLFEEAEKQRLMQMKENIKNDVNVIVEPEDLIELFKMHDIKIPLRTHGSFVKNINSVQIIKKQITSYRKVKGTTFSSDAINKALNILVNS